MKIRFLWDFFGPRAEGTAQHFEKHLLQFLAANALTLPTGLLKESEHHLVVYCDPPDVPQALREETVSSDETREPDSGPRGEAIADQIGRALRPNRVEPVPEGATQDV